MWRSGGGRLASPPAPRSFVHRHDGSGDATCRAGGRPARIPDADVPAIASELFENPNDLVGGMALARAVRDLVGEGLLYSNGLLVLPSCPALHVKRLSGGGGWAAWR